MHGMTQTVEASLFFMSLRVAGYTLLDTSASWSMLKCMLETLLQERVRKRRDDMDRGAKSGKVEVGKLIVENVDLILS
jgi:hypothetical protein